MSPTEHANGVESPQTQIPTIAEARLRASLGITVRLLVRQVVELGLWRVYGRAAARWFGGGAAARGAQGLVGRHVVPQVATLVIGQATDTVRLAGEQIDLDEYGRRSLRNASATFGGVVGSAAGAAVGSLVAPGPGTAVGAMLGATLGTLGGEVSVERWGPRPQPSEAGDGGGGVVLRE